MVEAAKCLRVPTSLTRSKSFIYCPNLAQETVVSIFPRFVDRRETIVKIRQAWMDARSFLCTIARENHSYAPPTERSRRVRGLRHVQPPPRPAIQRSRPRY